MVAIDLSGADGNLLLHEACVARSRSSVSQGYPTAARRNFSFLKDFPIRQLFGRLAWWKADLKPLACVPCGAGQLKARIKISLGRVRNATKLTYFGRNKQQ